MIPDTISIRQAFLILIFACLSSLVFNHFSPHRIELFGQWDESKGVVTAISKEIPLNTAIEIHHPNIVAQIVELKKRKILDVRVRTAYEDGHIPGALSYPLARFDEDIKNLLDTLKKDDPILVYCSSIQCTDSHTFSDRLIKLGYTDVKVFSGGFRQWEEMGFAVEKK